MAILRSRSMELLIPIAFTRSKNPYLRASGGKTTGRREKRERERRQAGERHQAGSTVRARAFAFLSCVFAVSEAGLFLFDRAFFITPELFLCWWFLASGLSLSLRASEPCPLGFCSYATLPCPILPYPTIPYHTIPFPTLPYPTLPYPTLRFLKYPARPGLSYPTEDDHHSSHSALSCHASLLPRLLAFLTACLTA